MSYGYYHLQEVRLISRFSVEVKSQEIISRRCPEIIHTSDPTQNNHYWPCVLGISVRDLDSVMLRFCSGRKKKQIYYHHFSPIFFRCGLSFLSRSLRGIIFSRSRVLVRHRRSGQALFIRVATSAWSLPSSLPSGIR